MLPEGLEAGLVGAFAVVAVYLMRDVATGEPLNTPSVLGTLLFEGLDAAREVRSAPGAAAAYNAVHLAVWTAFGFLLSSLMDLVEKAPKWRLLPWAAASCSLLVMVVLDLWVGETDLARPHLWLGGLAGLLSMAAYLAWRHPRAMAHLVGIGRF
jgi:hypothetical protein